MKTLRARTGPFTERPYFSDSEIEEMCAHELRMLGLYPEEPGPVRIDRFVEKRFNVVAEYAEMPSGLLGYTKFGPKGVEGMVVSTTFDEEGTPSALRRLRTTLAHEAGHGLLHTYLFAMAGANRSLFGDGLSDDGSKILCREQGKAKGKSDWWEVQANLVMGALLLPKPLVEKALAALYVPEGKLGLPRLPKDWEDEAARMLAEVFDVNPVVGRIRLQGLSTATDSRQLTL